MTLSHHPVDPALAMPEPLSVDPRFLDARLHTLASSDAAGRYTVLGEIARGGMASVLRVWDGDFQRPLAMKILISSNRESREGVSDRRRETELHRFLREAQITAQMDHPGIVRVHDIGINSDGDVYFTMGLIEGQDLGQIIDLARRREQGWCLNRALEVIIKVCETVAHAHSRSVIHRDLKPSNVMVGRFGNVYVMDWGLAKVLDERDRRGPRTGPEEDQAAPPSGWDVTRDRDATALLTMDGNVMGTPSYMSPEQAKGNIGELGPRSDVYSVGAMLYTLLAGHMPHVKPHARISAQAILLAARNGPPPSITDLDPDARPELVAICEKAMARRIEDRYADMNALAEDLRAHLGNRVVSAYRTGLFARSAKWTIRNKPLSMGVAVALAVLAVAGVHAFRVRTTADAELRQVRLELARVRGDALDAAAAAARADYAAHIVAADACLRVDELPEARLHIAACPDDLRGWEWDHLSARTQGKEAVWHVRAHEGKVHSVAFSADGALLASGGADRTVRVWDVALKRVVRILEGHEGEVRGVAFGPGGWIASGADDRTVRLWKPGREEVLAILGGHGGAVNAVAFHGQDGRLVSGSDDGTLRVWDALAGKPVLTLHGHGDAVTAVASSPDGTRIASASRDGTLRLWNGETGEEIRMCPRPDLAAIALDEGLLAAACTRGDVELRNGTSGEALSTLPAWKGGVSSLAFGPGRGRLASGGEDGRVRLWELEGGSLLLVLPGHGGRISGVAFSPNFSLLAAASWDGTLTLWEGTLARSVAGDT